MQARPIHSRGDLINCIRGRGRVTACNRAIESGITIVLGGFTPSQDICYRSLEPYWVVQVCSRYNQVWNLTVCSEGTECKVRVIPEVDWLNWRGDATGPPSIYNGDDPTYCNHQHLNAVEVKEINDGSTKTD